MSEQTETVAKAEYESLKTKFTEAGGKIADLEKVVEKVNKAGGWDKISSTLEAFTILEKEREDLEKEVAESKPDKLKEWKEKTESKVRSSIQAELDGFRTRAETSEKKYKELAVVDRTFSAAASKLVQAAHDDFKSLARAHGDLDEKGNLIFKNEKGETLYKEGSTTEPMDANDFVNWAVKVKPHYFASTTVSGDRESGTTSASSGHGITVDQYLSMSPAEHAKIPLKVRAELAVKARQAKRI